MTEIANQSDPKWWTLVILLLISLGPMLAGLVSTITVGPIILRRTRFMSPAYQFGLFFILFGLFLIGTGSYLMQMRIRIPLQLLVLTDASLIGVLYGVAHLLYIMNIDKTLFFASVHVVATLLLGVAAVLVFGFTTFQVLVSMTPVSIVTWVFLSKKYNESV